MISSILLVAVFISILITIHEFGHLLVAKLAHIPVEVFSIGFGPTILKRKIRETEYRLSLVPLGGYIRMAGDEDDTVGGFNDKSFGVKAAVIAAGPVSNLILGFVLMTVMFAVFGVRYVAPVVDPAPDSPAALAGLLPEDLVLTAGGDTIPDYSTFEQVAERNAGSTIPVVVSRKGHRVELQIPIPADTWFTSLRIRPIAGGVKAGGPAEQIGIEPGDSILTIGPDTLHAWSDLVRMVRDKPGATLPITWVRNDSVRHDSITLAVTEDPATGLAVGQIGIWVRMPPRDIEPWIPPIVGQVRAGGPAAGIGIRTGDLIVSVDGKPVRRWDEVTAAIGMQPGERTQVSWQHAGETLVDSVTPALEKDQLTGDKRGVLGVWVRLEKHTLSIPAAVWEGLKRTGYVVVQTFVIIYKVIARKIPARAIGGPVFVAKIAYEGASWGAEYFIALWALLSINLFVVNLLPVPVLDGGRILLFVIEKVRRRRLSEREMSWAMNIGWAIIGLIFVLVLFNDVLRLIGK
jgi:regulator of sigma E protease